jgi:hypothetical protein
MNAHVRDALVDGYQTLIPALKLPDPEDCHVLAAAIQCRADLSLTFNFNDFPVLDLATHGISARHPDRFLVNQLTQALDRVCTANPAAPSEPEEPAKNCRGVLEDPEAAGITYVFVGCPRLLLRALISTAF